MKKFAWRVGNIQAVHFRMKVNGFTLRISGELIGGTELAVALSTAPHGWSMNLLFAVMTVKWMN
jgi:hypothetical protein